MFDLEVKAALLGMPAWACSPALLLVRVPVSLRPACSPAVLLVRVPVALRGHSDGSSACVSEPRGGDLASVHSSWLWFARTLAILQSEQIDKCALLSCE